MQTIQQRVDRDISRRLFLGGTAAMLAPLREAAGQVPASARAQAPADRPILLSKVRLFDGVCSSA
ncbi:MAG: hypothetical protein SNJ79_11375, partial [Sphingomonadaceae bacterium]